MLFSSIYNPFDKGHKDNNCERQQGNKKGQMMKQCFIVWP